jgi:hypothetical protein
MGCDKMPTFQRSVTPPPASQPRSPRLETAPPRNPQNSDVTPDITSVSRSAVQRFVSRVRMINDRQNTLLSLLLAQQRNMQFVSIEDVSSAPCRNANNYWRF